MLFLFWVKVKAINQYTPLKSGWNNTNILEQKYVFLKPVLQMPERKDLLWYYKVSLFTVLYRDEWKG